MGQWILNLTPCSSVAVPRVLAVHTPASNTHRSLIPYALVALLSSGSRILLNRWVKKNSLFVEVPLFIFANCCQPLPVPILCLFPTDLTISPKLEVLVCQGP